MKIFLLKVTLCTLLESLSWKYVTELIPIWFDSVHMYAECKDHPKILKAPHSMRGQQEHHRRVSAAPSRFIFLTT